MYEDSKKEHSVENPMPFCRECGKDIQEDWKVCPHCEVSLSPSDKETSSQSASVLVQDGVIGGDLNISQIEGGSNKCSSCKAENVRVMSCQEGGCATVFCELCHPLCRWSYTKGSTKFDSGDGGGPYCERCLFQKKKRSVHREKSLRMLANKKAGIEKAISNNDAIIQEFENSLASYSSDLHETTNLEMMWLERYEAQKNDLDRWESTLNTHKEYIEQQEPIHNFWWFVSFVAFIGWLMLILWLTGKLESEGPEEMWPTMILASGSSYLLYLLFIFTGNQDPDNNARQPKTWEKYETLYNRDGINEHTDKDSERRNQFPGFERVAIIQMKECRREVSVAESELLGRTIPTPQYKIKNLTNQKSKDVESKIDPLRVQNFNYREEINTLDAKMSHLENEV
jgi:hypothetical protein